MNIEEFEWDHGNIGHIARHGLTEAQIEALLDGRYLVLRNKNTSTGDYRLIGREPGGRLITVVVVNTAVAWRWRPITGWYSNAAEERRARRSGI